jgi:hypothetical protein
LKLLEQYRLLHNEGLFRGKSLSKHIESIGELVQTYECKTLLDYGSGKGVCHDEKTKYWGVKVTLYDPAVTGLDFLPNSKFDAVISTDVLEHIPEDELDEALENIFSRADKFVFLSISTQLAKKVLPNGLNAHVTVKPQEWWLAKIEPYKTCSTSVHFS